LLDPDRVNLFERWESQAALKAFRRKAPRNMQRAAMLSVSVAENDIADARPLFGKENVKRAAPSGGSAAVGSAALKPLSERLQETAHALLALGRHLVGIEERALPVKTSRVPSRSGLNSAVATETEMRIASRSISYV
jgi:hypothetical protein